MRPFSIVHDKYFRKYARYLNSVRGRVRIPKSWKTREGVEIIAAQLRETLKEKIGTECLYYSASSDIWTARSKLAFISFTLHYLNEMFQMRSWVLEVKLLSGKHDGYRIAEALEHIMTEWELPLEKCVKFLRDGASNGVKACELLQVDSMSCLVHCLHLIVGSGIVKKKTGKSSRELMAAARTDADFDAAIEQEACEGIDAFITDTCESARTDLETLRGVVEKSRKMAVFFSRSVKGTDCLKTFKPKSFSLRQTVQHVGIVLTPCCYEF
ncbi:putative AC transposase [Phytophthora citrophthora]|uniref:AC transposase n=1 Tax=Phytophthora citrophthora TaxID=4793 RepID=A0AAD9GB42_9STRA|nr:putative AC transposase [Phytophthora citrophthora]